jgi:hypothetical protein
VSAVHVPGGTFIHSAIALAPYSYILALEGIVVTIAWVARRRPTWDAESANRVFISGAVAFAVVCAVSGALLVHGTWSSRAERFRAIASALDTAGAPATDRVMSIDASGTKYWTGRGGVVLVNDPLDTIEAVARAYDIDWLVLDAGDSVESVAPVLDMSLRPAWLGDPIAMPAAYPDVAIYPVTGSGAP